MIKPTYPTKTGICTSKERLKAHRDRKALRQIVASLNTDDKPNSKEHEAADSFEDLIAHIIEIGQNDQNENNDDSDHSFPNILSIQDVDESRPSQPYLRIPS